MRGLVVLFLSLAVAFAAHHDALQPQGGDPPPATPPAPAPAPAPATPATSPAAPPAAPAVPQGPRYITPVYDNDCSYATRKANGCCGSTPSKCCVPTDECGRKVVVVESGNGCTSTRAARCCSSAHDTCCNKGCTVEPEYKKDECATVKVFSCCTRPAQKCCNECGSSFSTNFAEMEATATIPLTEAEQQAVVFNEEPALVEAEAEQEFKGVCSEQIRLVRCCQTQASQCCSRPCTKIGDMVMGKLQLQDSCTDAIKASTCCSTVRTSCCNPCQQQQQNQPTVQIVPVQLVQPNSGSCSDEQRNTCCQKTITFTSSSSSSNPCCKQC